MRHQRRTAAITTTTTTTIKERVQCKKSLKLKGNNTPLPPCHCQEMLNSFVSTYHLHKRQHNRKDIEAAQGVEKKTQTRIRLKKENKKCNYEHKKKRERVRERERSELEIIAECQIGLYTYDMYDSTRYLRVYRLFAIVSTWFVFKSKSDYNLAAVGTSWLWAWLSVPSARHKIKTTKNWIVFYEIYYNILYAYRKYIQACVREWIIRWITPCR